MVRFVSGRPFFSKSWFRDLEIPILSKYIAEDFVITRYISPGPDITKNAFDSEGFFKTGDLGKIEDGVVYLLGRASQDGIEYSIPFRKLR